LIQENSDPLTEKANPQEESYDSACSRTLREQNKFFLEAGENNYSDGVGDYKDH
jgi:hypothetical protein